MQWLIDLIIEAIGVPPCYIDRGDPAAIDFVIGDFTRDNAWHNLDLSAIVPANATAIAIKILMRATVTNNHLLLRKNGNANTINSTQIRTQAGGVYYGADCVVTPDGDRKIEYLVAAANWQDIDLVVKGWWL